jgi:hypothetical protein
VNLTDKSAAERAAARLGYWSALLTAILAAVTLGIAIATPPISGPFCVSGCVGYPYTDIVARFPLTITGFIGHVAHGGVMSGCGRVSPAPPGARAWPAGAALAGMAAAVISRLLSCDGGAPSLLQSNWTASSLDPV